MGGIVCIVTWLMELMHVENNLGVMHHVSVRSSYRKVTYDVTQLAGKKRLTKSCELCRKGIGQTPTLGAVLRSDAI